MELLTAKEARERTTDFNVENDRAYLQGIIEKINKAIEVGKFSIDTSGGLRPSVEKILREKGYTIEKKNDRDSPFATISWGIF